MIRARHVRHAQDAAREYYGLSLSPAQARQVLECDPDLIPELDRDGDLDTLPREDLGGAILAAFMPGAPTATDDLIGHRLESWHWPMNGSGIAYRRAFYRAFRVAMKQHNIAPEIKR